MPEKPKLRVILVGGLERHPDGTVINATSTVTLIRGERNYLVDTGRPGTEDALIFALNRVGLATKDIHTIILTHLHSDHWGCVHLFPDAKILVHPEEPVDVVRRNLTFVGEGEIEHGIRILHTPGHTPGHISVIVRAQRVFAVAGDAIPTPSNLLKWLPPFYRFDTKLAVESMKKLVKTAEFIIPGHGPVVRSALAGRKGEKKEGSQ